MKKRKLSKPTPRGLPTLDRLAERLQEVDLWEVGKNLTDKEKAERLTWLASNSQGS